MTACEIAVQGSVDDLPNASVLSDSLGRLRQEGQAFHAKVSTAVDELQITLNEARTTGIMMKHGPLFSNPATKAVGWMLVEAVDQAVPKVREVSDVVETLFEGFDMAAGGAGNPDRVAAIAEHLDTEVSARLTEFADALSVSQLDTPGRWDSPAADAYFQRADSQSTDGLRPLAASIKSAAQSLETYADSQVEYANEVAQLWVKIFWTMAALYALVLSGISIIGGAVNSSGGNVAWKVFEVAGWAGTFVSLVSFDFMYSSLLSDVGEVRDMPDAPCHALNEHLRGAVGDVGFRWPAFSQEPGASQ